MFPRKRLDISWRQLCFAARACFSARGADRIAAQLEKAWGDQSLVCFSVRTGLDLYLQAANWPEGGEVVMSAMTIPEMARIIELHGLVPIPIDLDPGTLEPDLPQLERAINSRTKAFLFAHLFGARSRLEEAIALAHRRGIEVIEDCAQAFSGMDRLGHPESDAAFFSFGPIKTATALGGAVAQIKDPARLNAMRRIQAMYPAQRRRGFLKRVLKFACLRVLSEPVVYGWFAWACRKLGRSHDQIIRNSVKSFPAMNLARLRFRPSAPLLSLLEQRLREFSSEQIAHRTSAGLDWAGQLPETVHHPGSRAAVHTFWIFPVLVRRPHEVIRHLREHGFDASDVTSTLIVVPARARCEGLDPKALREMARQLVYLPLDASMPISEQQRLLACLAEAVRVERMGLPHRRAGLEGDRKGIGPEQLQASPSGKTGICR